MAEGDRMPQGTSHQRSLLALALRSPATLQLQQPQVCHRAPACLLVADGGGSGTPRCGNSC